jgi:hypothetical protein
MNSKTFDNLTRTLAAAASRRTAALAVAGAALGLVAAQLPEAQAGKKRKQRRNRNKNKNKALTFNAFGCVDVGKPCRGKDANCCSGICQGKKPNKGEKDKSRCVAHNVGGCQSGQDFCLGELVACGDAGFCSTTTGNGAFCGGDGTCTDCKNDSECAAEVGPGAACVVCAGLCPDGVNTLCVLPGD